MPSEILIVDDDANIRSLLDYRLAKEGYSVILCATGEEALDRIVRDQPDLVILDLVLPGLDGWEVIDLLKQDKETCDIPILVLTAYGFEENRKRGSELGVSGFLAKP